MKGVKYNLFFQDKTGNDLNFQDLKMSELLTKLENLLNEFAIVILVPNVALHCAPNSFPF